MRGLKASFRKETLEELQRIRLDKLSNRTETKRIAIANANGRSQRALTKHVQLGQFIFMMTSKNERPTFMLGDTKDAPSTIFTLRKGTESPFSPAPPKQHGSRS